MTAKTTDILIPEPSGDLGTVEEMNLLLARQSKVGEFNFTYVRQHRKILIKLASLSISAVAVAKQSQSISNPPAQAEVVALQATVNTLIDAFNAMTAELAALVTEAKADLKNLADRS